MESVYQNFWIPQYQWQLVGWLARRFNCPESRFGRMPRKQRWAIYLKERRRV